MTGAEGCRERRGYASASLLRRDNANGGRGATMEHGVVLWFDAGLGHGFIRDDDGTEILVHYSQIDGSGYRFLTGGQQVRFEIGYGIFGRHAVNVQVC